MLWKKRALVAGAALAGSTVGAALAGITLEDVIMAVIMAFVYAVMFSVLIFFLNPLFCCHIMRSCNRQR